ncbi:MAG: BolA/IbaG family iron-sulfur metabolism protein [Legionella sp.]|nr:BolA/IbaG family iron-sulfur metabolism protein [Legionella sp.]
MISNEALEKYLLDKPDVDFVKVEGDGYHYQLVIVSDVFVGKSIVKRQQWVYSQLKDYITSGSLHALSMKTWTKEEWEKTRG